MCLTTGILVILVSRKPKELKDIWFLIQSCMCTKCLLFTMYNAYTYRSLYIFVGITLQPIQPKLVSQVLPTQPVIASCRGVILAFRDLVNFLSLAHLVCPPPPWCTQQMIRFKMMDVCCFLQTHLQKTDDKRFDSFS